MSELFPVPHDAPQIEANDTVTIPTMNNRQGIVCGTNPRDFKDGAGEVEAAYVVIEGGGYYWRAWVPLSDLVLEKKGTIKRGSKA